MLNVKFTCCVCGNKFSKQQGDVDERMCDECLNHEDKFGEAAKAEDKEYKAEYQPWPSNVTVRYLEADVKKIIVTIADLEQKLINLNTSIKFKMNEIMLIVEQLTEDKK
tara:strand:- start:1591 stop:1917 length:327 start_codon:yes stop_codon:yes gene_type:complete